jgi:hypothetical protein
MSELGGMGETPLPQEGDEPTQPAPTQEPTPGTEEGNSGNSEAPASDESGA